MVVMFGLAAENELGQYPHLFHDGTGSLVPSPWYRMGSGIKCNPGTISEMMVNSVPLLWCLLFGFATGLVKVYWNGCLLPNSQANLFLIMGSGGSIDSSFNLVISILISGEIPPKFHCMDAPASFSNAMSLSSPVLFVFLYSAHTWKERLNGLIISPHNPGVLINTAWKDIPNQSEILLSFQVFLYQHKGNQPDRSTPRTDVDSIRGKSTYI